MNKFKFREHLVFIIILSFAAFLLESCEDAESAQAGLRINAKLTSAPFAPAPISRDYPAKVKVELEVREFVGKLSAGVEYTYWTFGGDVPGKFIRVREGDEIEFHLHNHPSSKLPHNIDLHAVTGPGGGAVSSFTTPGHTSVFSFKTMNPGLYVYHCATAPVGLHIANGMYGLILVEPEEGLPPVDREYYVMQGEFYTAGNYGEKGFQPFSMEKALDENPDYVVFNGSVGSLVGDRSLKARVGERVRIFIGNGGPNLVSSFHVIGEIFDVVYQEGWNGCKTENVQTTLVPAGGAAIVEFDVNVPGEFILVDHSIFRAFNKGALGKINVIGADDPEIYSGKIEDKLYSGFEQTLSSIDPRTGRYDSNEEKKYEPQFSAEAVETDYSELREAANGSHKNTAQATGSNFAALGRKVYQNSCIACHQSDGSGIPNVFPPIKNSDWIKKNGNAAMISAVISGLNGPLKVNGKEYNNIMPPQQLSDKKIAAVLTYVYQSINNTKETVTIEKVKQVRKSNQLTIN